APDGPASAGQSPRRGGPSSVLGLDRSSLALSAAGAAGGRCVPWSVLRVRPRNVPPLQAAHVLRAIWATLPLRCAAAERSRLLCGAVEERTGDRNARSHRRTGPDAHHPTDKVRLATRGWED